MLNIDRSSECYFDPICSFFPIKLHVLSFIRLAIPSYFFTAFLSTISQYRLSASGTVKISFVYFNPWRQSLVYYTACTCHCSLSLLWAVLWRGRHKDVLDVRTGSPPLSLYLSHLIKGKDSIAGKATPTQAFSRCCSWHGCEHMGGKKSEASLPWCVFSAYWDETRSVCFVSTEKVMMMNWLFLLCSATRIRSKFIRCK